MGRRNAERSEQKSRNRHHQVQNNRRRGRRGKASQRIQNPGLKRNDGNKQQKGEGYAGQGNRQFNLAAAFGESGRQGDDNRRHENFHQYNEQSQKKYQYGNGLRGESDAVFAFADRQFLREHRNEGGRKGAFAEKTAEEIGEFEGDKKSVGNGAGAENVGQNHIPDKTGNAADEREASECGY